MQGIVAVCCAVAFNSSTVCLAEGLEGAAGDCVRKGNGCWAGNQIMK